MGSRKAGLSVFLHVIPFLYPHHSLTLPPSTSTLFCDIKLNKRNSAVLKSAWLEDMLISVPHLKLVFDYFSVANKLGFYRITHF